MRPDEVRPVGLYDQSMFPGDEPLVQQAPKGAPFTSTPRCNVCGCGIVFKQQECSEPNTCADCFHAARLERIAESMQESARVMKAAAQDFIDALTPEFDKTEVLG